MKYIHNHPSKDFDKALGLDKKAVERLQNAIQNAYGSPLVGSVDDIMNLVAPYIHSAEEGCYAAMVIFTDVEGAKNQVYTKSN